MEDMFRAAYTGDRDDGTLVAGAQCGDKAALEALIGRHQEWIYNIALRMVGNPDDAADVTQEILVKLMTRLSSFEKRSSFRTWVYRIVVNHVLTMRRRVWERLFYSFERHGALIESLQDAGAGYAPPDPAEEKLLRDETRTGCLTAMLLCLDRSERIALILGTLFGVSSTLGGDLMEITPENYRQIVSRARKRLANFMNEKCGLMNEANTCRCAKTIPAAAKAGLVNPKRLRFDLPWLHRVQDLVAEKAPLVDAALEMRLQNLLREQPLYTAPDFKRLIGVILRRRDVEEIINFN